VTSAIGTSTTASAVAANTATQAQTVTTNNGINPTTLSPQE
jgi:hypothetical protein